VVPLRDGATDGDGRRLEMLMVRRVEAIAYGGMWAFPGGRIDPGDADPGLPGDVLAAARRVAVRVPQVRPGVTSSGDAGRCSRSDPPG